VLARLTREDVVRMLAGLTVAPGTRRHIYNVLRIALNEAVRSEVVRQNVALRVTPPEATHPPFQPWDAAEINAFLDTLEGNAHGPLFTLAIATGLPQGELLGLRWSDLDLEAGTLTVARQWTRAREMAEPKSAAGVRTLGINELARGALRAQRARQTVQRLDGLIFTTDAGEPLQSSGRHVGIRAGDQPGGGAPGPLP
jgi:integrase